MNFQEVFMRRRIIVLATFALGSVVLRADEQKSKIENSLAYDKMKTLVGSWEGKVNEGGTALKTDARFNSSPTAQCSLRGWAKAVRMKWS